MSTATKTKPPLLLPGAERCRRKFLRYFPTGFYDEKYYGWERGYKWDAHERWTVALGEKEFRNLLDGKKFNEIATRALRALSRTNLLFSFESMALRDALRSPIGVRNFAEGLFKFVYGPGREEPKFEAWCDVVGSLPKKQSRVFTHPVVTVFGSIAVPQKHIFLKPVVTRKAAERYGFDFIYSSRPSWKTYSSLLAFAEIIRQDLGDLKPRDMIDIQSFIWVQGSDEYA